MSDPRKNKVKKPRKCVYAMNPLQQLVRGLKRAFSNKFRAIGFVLALVTAFFSILQIFFKNQVLLNGAPLNFGWEAGILGLIAILLAMFMRD